MAKNVAKYFAKKLNQPLQQRNEAVGLTPRYWLKIYFTEQWMFRLIVVSYTFYLTGILFQPAGNTCSCFSKFSNFSWGKTDFQAMS